MDTPERRQRAAETFRLISDQLGDESDRGAVLVAAAILDEMLTERIRRRLLPPTGGEDELFDGANAPLHSFSSRIDLAYRLDVLRPSMRRSLHIVRKIRNDFAHRSAPAKFEDETVRNRVRELFRINEDILAAMWEVMEGAREQWKCLAANPDAAHAVELIGWRNTFNLLIGALVAGLESSNDDIESISQLIDRAYGPEESREEHASPETEEQK